MLATGAEPTRLPVPGADHPAVRVIRTLDHVRELTRRLNDGDSVVVIGSGFIGCEIAASLKRRGHQVTLVSDERSPTPHASAPRRREQIRRWLDEEGVGVKLGAEVDEIAAARRLARGASRAGPRAGNVVVMAAGVAPRAELASPPGSSSRRAPSQ